MISTVAAHSLATGVELLRALYLPEFSDRPLAANPSDVRTDRSKMGGITGISKYE